MPDIGFFDAQCPRCKRRFGWMGTLVDRPPCPRCKYQHTLNEDDAKEIADFRDLLRQRKENRDAADS
jgi:phage FluMu protein Com